jgi:hypothetical protein
VAPRAVLAKTAVDAVLGLTDIPEALARYCSRSSAPRGSRGAS